MAKMVHIPMTDIDALMLGRLPGYKLHSIERMDETGGYDYYQIVVKDAEDSFLMSYYRTNSEVKPFEEWRGAVLNEVKAQWNQELGASEWQYTAFGTTLST